MSHPKPNGDKSEPDENRLAYIALCCGLASCVPLVILATFIPAIVFGVLALVKAARLPGHPGKGAAAAGIGVALASLAIQAFVAGLAGVIGLF